MRERGVQAIQFKPVAVGACAKNRGCWTKARLRQSMDKLMLKSRCILFG